ncbi:MAG: methylated-DNA--[protein]-cysteine S-methyltransferase [Alphaproteobacteria bacterium]|uniref:Methylated-DNA--protein-cysteine methyltransferase n=1 Tax=Candidatus Nitrobium versatile TaxID=2884831 RepID=A0A953SH38_9BACT|nr:methylated-DNA--[protein]-cysteine S-methyltransferase [Candidatus Nitrobium versatile]
MLYDTFRSPLGLLYLIFWEDALAEIRFERNTRELFPASYRKGQAPGHFKEQLREYFLGNLQRFDVDVVFTRGSEFDMTVWWYLKEIPYGETRTYKWLAHRIGNPGAVRAVGRALGRNPLPIVFPCHRVIKSDGSLCGYASGVEAKSNLLALERYARAR